METVEIELSRIFIKVVQQGSFTKAADLLKIPKSTVSKSITKLETLTGTKLLLRTTRSQSLTEAGRDFYEICNGPIQVLEDAQKSLYGIDSHASGHIKITAPEDLGTHLIAPVIGKLSSEYPRLSFDLQYSNKIIDLVKDGFDLAIRIGKLKDSQLISKKIGRLELILVAAPEYLVKSKKIKVVEDLVSHRCISISGLNISRNWELEKANKKIKISISPHVESNQMSSLIEVAKGGAGILLAPSFICRQAIEKGELVRVLDSWTNKGLPVSIVSPISISSTARLKVVTDQIFAALKDELVLS